MKYILPILLLGLTTKSTAASCGICDDGVMMSNPNKTVPLFKDDGFDEVTCQEKDDILSSNETLTDDGECMLARGMFEMDLAVWCGCEGAEPDVNNGDCTLCQEGEEFNNKDGESITAGYPLQNGVVTCSMVKEIAPLVRYISTCEDFHEWYGTDVCCYQTIISEGPTPAPTPSSATNHVSKGLFVVAGGLMNLLFA